MKNIQIFCALLALTLLAGCAETQFGANMAKQLGNERSKANYKVGKPYLIDGQEYYPQESFDYSETGIASWYGPGFHGKHTANGERFDTNDLTAAHRTLQMPSLVRVTNLENGRSMVLRVNDRGPYARGRVIDVSSKAADLLGFKGRGTAKVRVDILSEESRRIAEDARMGKDTRGYEIALNNPNAKILMPTSVPASATQEPMEAIKVASVQSESLPPIEGHVLNDGRFMPDPVVTIQPVTRTSIYVQAGAFGDQNNAQNLSNRLSTIGSAKVYPTNVGGRSFYRVRLGPYATVEQADAALNGVLGSGIEKAVIVVE